MRRRTLIVGLLGSAGGGALAACGSGAGTPGVTGVTAPPASAAPRISRATTASASAAPILGSTAASTLVPRPVTMPYVPPPGSAPVREYPVGWRTLSFARGADRPLPTTVWYPATTPAQGAPAASGRFPLLLFSHGLDAVPDMYATIADRWVRAGFVVAAPTYPHTARGVADFDPLDLVNQPADASSVLDQLLATGPLTGVMDPRRLAAGGHSGGGITTAGLFSARRDGRLRAGVIFAGTDFQGQPFTGPAAAMLFIHGRKDDTVTWRAGHTVFAAVPWSRAMLSITEGGHSIDEHDFEVATGTSTEFLRWSLYGDAAAKARIPAAAAAGGVATLENQL
jgi:dienelactone hydrolase